VSSRDFIAIAAQYQADILAGVIPACLQVRQACERNRRDLDRQDTPHFPYRFDPDAARRICQMAEMLPHVKGDKARVIGQDDEGRQVWATISLEPWQCWILTTLFGWLRVDGRRRFRSGLVLVPRKNAKSTMGAVIALYMLTADGESGAECYSAATSRDQAKVVAEIAWEMARRSPSFREYFGVKLGSKTTLSLTVPGNGSKFMPLSADAHSLDGLNVFFAIVDELHAHRTRAVWDVLDTATGARLQPLLLAITTAGVDTGGICHERLAYLERVLGGTVADESHFGINYTIDQGDDYWLPAVAQKANPNWGVSVDPEDIARKMLMAKHSQSALNDKLTKHFNVWIRTESAWMSSALWQTCAGDGLTIEQFKDYPCWIGVDLAEVRDIAAVVILFKVGDKYVQFGRFYLPEAAVAKSPIAQLSGWVRQKFIIQTDGDQADFLRIEDDIVALCDTYKVQEIDFDRALAAQMQQSLKRRLEPRMGKDAVDRFIINVKQDTPTMDAAMKMTERLVLGKQLQHDANPAMAWMVSNIVVNRSPSSDEIRPSKAGGKDSPNKIDGPVAWFTCLSQAMVGPTPSPEYRLFFVGGSRR
jgi:phage terminase large subunit-like protein